ncbi:YgjV family protein [Nocardioides sp. B-3]|uniref:YgjV family protein n=1 Tax=Nocardioides sp. B-3 TaxID=2895565 RepID=UPI0021536722|nr:YgjV family protein [Nocardioides sp. B-3]UUZ59732.1 YgjV family protein [Nocardioides sp. B-3]
MTRLYDHWLDILGWGGSALPVYSLLQSRLIRLRVLNLAACLILTVFNWALEARPMVGMNIVLAAINLWFILKLLRERHDEAAFEVLQVRGDDEYLRHILRVHAADILRFNPAFIHDPGADDRDAFLVTRGDETVGVVLLTAVGDSAHVLLDYVTPRYRDFSPGEFIWRKSGMLSSHGYRRVVTSPEMVAPYYDRVGFDRVGGSRVLELSP